MTDATKTVRERSLLDRYFGLRESGSDVGTGFGAGVTTLLTTVSFVFVNPQILSSAGMDKGAVFVANLHCGCRFDAGDGALCQLSDRARAGNGAQCVLRLHRGARAQIQLAAGARRRVLFRGDLLPDLDLQHP